MLSEAPQPLTPAPPERRDPGLQGRAPDGADRRRRSGASRADAETAVAARLHRVQRADGDDVPGTRRATASPTCCCSTSRCRAWTAGRSRESCATPGMRGAQIMMVSANADECRTRPSLAQPLPRRLLIKPIDCGRCSNSIGRLLAARLAARTAERRRAGVASPPASRCRRAAISRNCITRPDRLCARHRGQARRDRGRARPTLAPFVAQLRALVDRLRARAVHDASWRRCRSR